MCVEANPNVRSALAVNKQLSKPLETIEQAIELMMDPIVASPARGKQVIGVVCVHVDDLFFTGAKEFIKEFVSNIQKDFQVGTQVENDF